MITTPSPILKGLMPQCKKGMHIWCHLKMIAMLNQQPQAIQQSIFMKFQIAR